MLIVGHRGAAARAPENTAVSLVAGLDAGADAIEIDVGLTRDGRVVLLHDATVDRTTSGRGALRSLTWERVRALDAGSWFSRRFKGEPPIDLDDALAIVRARVPIIVEIKPAAHDRETVDAVLACIARTGGTRCCRSTPTRGLRSRRTVAAPSRGSRSSSRSPTWSR